MPGQDNNPSTDIPPEFLGDFQLNQDIRFVISILPESSHYTVQESKSKKYSIHCKSALGIPDYPDTEWNEIFAKIKNHFGERFQEVYHSTCANHCNFTIYLKAWEDKPGLLEQLKKPHIAQYPRTPQEAHALVTEVYGQKSEDNKDLLSELTALIREADRRFHDGSIGGGTRHYVRDVLIPLMEEKGLCFCRIIK